MFPEIKDKIIEKVEYTGVPVLFEKNNQNIFNENTEINFFINVFINIYALTIYLIKQINCINIRYCKQNKNYSNYLEKCFNLQLSGKIFEIFKKGFNEEIKMIDIFEEEKNKVITIFQNRLQKIKESSKDIPKKLKKKEIELYKKLQDDEIKNYEETIKIMADIRLDDLQTRLEKYLDYDILSYANSKFEVLLFLHQNKYI